MAMTRAMDVLYLTSAKKRKIQGRLVPRTISPDITDVEYLFKQMNKGGDRKRPPKPQTQRGLLC